MKNLVLSLIAISTGTFLATPQQGFAKESNDAKSSASAIVPGSNLVVSRVKIKHAPSEVAVFMDRGIITRTGTCSLKKGKNEIVFSAIRDNIDLRSIRAGNTELPGVEIVGIVWERHVSAVVDNVKIAAIEEKLNAISAKMDELRDKSNAVKKGSQLLTQYFNQSFLNSVARESVLGEVSAKTQDSWENAAKKLSEEIEKCNSKAADLDHEIENIEREEYLPTIKEREEAYGSGSARKSLSLVVSVISDRDIPAADISVSYMTRHACWVPQYDVRVNEADKSAEFSYNAAITQNTGEDWENVKLTLSTAQPQISAQPPAVKRINLTGSKLSAETQRVIMAREGVKSSDKMTSQVVMSDAEIAEMSPENSGYSRARKEGASVSIAINGRHNIPSANKSQQIVVAKQDVKNISLDCEAAPRVRNGVYYRAKFRNNLPYPILAGVVNIGRGFGFIGKSELKFAPIGSEVDFFAGMLDGISSSETTFPAYSKKGSVFSSSAASEVGGVSYKFQNITGTPRKVRVRSQIPLSEVEDVQIKILTENVKHIPATTPGYVFEKETGMIYWDIVLPANDKAQIILSGEKIIRE